MNMYIKKSRRSEERNKFVTEKYDILVPWGLLFHSPADSFP